MIRHSLINLVACLALAAGTSAALAQVGTSVTYQGQLKSSGVAVNSPSDVRFSLWDAATLADLARFEGFGGISCLLRETGSGT